MNPLRGGSILRVNLTDRRVSTEPIEPYLRFIGGKGVNIKLLFEGAEAETEPLGAENVLLFGAGTLVGTPLWGACRTDVMAKSPVTGHYGNAGMGGYFGAELKFAGYDHLVVEGCADRPVYLAIADDRVEIRDASAVWGRDTYETPAIIQDEIGDPRVQVICIGQAGENRVVYAAVMSGTGNAAGRTGMGAVMGSKNLKAVAVRGTRGLTIARPEEFLARCKSLLEDIRETRNYEELHTYGLTRIHDREMRAAYRLIGTDWEDGETIREAEFISEHLDRRVGCFACPVACFDGYNIKGAGSGTAKCSPYGDLSWDLRNADLMVFWKSYVDCQRYGLDARSLSNALAWLMKLHENRVITADDTDGMAMEWGNTKAIIDMTRKMSLREGIGDLLADGLPQAAEKIGRNSADYLVMSKGSPSDMHVVPVKTIGLGSAVSAIGEDLQTQPFISYAAAQKYLRADNEEAFQEAIRKYKDRTEREVGSREAAEPRTTEGKAALVRQEEERTDIIDMTGVCAWLTAFTGLPISTEVIAECMTLGLGRDVEPVELKDAATGLRHLERAFLGKCGLTRDDDRLSKAYYGRIRPGGKPLPELGFSPEELERMKDDYYTLMGWDLKTGLPTRETLTRYGLEDVADGMGDSETP